MAHAPAKLEASTIGPLMDDASSMLHIGSQDWFPLSFFACTFQFQLSARRFPCTMVTLAA